MTALHPTIGNRLVLGAAQLVSALVGFGGPIIVVGVAALGARGR